MELHRHPQPQPQPHAVLFPYPAQGHINPMMQLATKLLSSGFFITFVNTDFNHQRMLDNESSRHLLQLPNLRFEHLPDGLPPSHGRFIQSVPECTAAILSLPEPFAQLVKKIMAGSSPPLTCIIADSFCSWMQDVADKFGVPRVSLWTTPVHANMVYHFQSILISQGYIPLKDKGKASHVITCIPGVVPMPLSEHISFFLVEDSSDYLFQWHLNQCMRRPNEAAWNLGNNFVDLENEAVEAFQKEAKNFLPIGPLIPQTLLKGKGCRGQGGLSVWAEEGGCEAWLAEQEERSVLYISFGSIASMGAEEVEEMVKGVEESGVPFMWAVRPDQEGKALKGLRRRLAAEEDAQKGGKRGMMVGWAPQLNVLAHTAVGAFLTHCGWNSVVESICAGVPILAKPGGFAEQKMNAYYIANVWRLGLRLPPSPDLPLSRNMVANQIRALFGNEPQAIDVRRRLATVRGAALAALSASGASNASFRLFVEDMHRRARSCSSCASPPLPLLNDCHDKNCGATLGQKEIVLNERFKIEHEKCQLIDEDGEVKHSKIERLRENIQLQCKAINLLGKCISGLQEDAEIISKEYQFWIKEWQNDSYKLKLEQRITKEKIQVKDGHVKLLEDEILYHQNKITALKAEVLLNDDNIAHLLRKISPRMGEVS